MSAWLASFTRRWHANADLCHTVDPVSAHSCRMAILALDIWGADASRDLLVACLCHDMGEATTGDVPAPAKRDPGLRAALIRLEDEALDDLGLSFSLSAEDADRLTFLDRLDAYKWAQHHAPHILDRAGWSAQRIWLIQESDRLRVRVAL
jgi:5'-deoxynucleotidase YfbR-like HD superfamily hydrolase